MKANFDPTDSRSKAVTFIITGYCTAILDGWREGGDPTDAFTALGPGSESSGLPKPVPTLQCIANHCNLVGTDRICYFGIVLHSI